jgi:DNA repair protein RecN (Recombination protein N)
MLTTLRIKNLALVEDLTLDLRSGFNAITGETGTGKSVILGALNLVLGERADRTLIRTGSESCTVEAVFDTRLLRAPLPGFLEENGLEACEEHQLVIKRVFTLAGTNRQFINGSPTTLGTLATLGQWLVDIHGPHDHQSLLHPAQQLDILDAFGGLARPRAAFADLVRQRAALEAAKAALIVDERTYAQQVDLLRFQAREIEAARLEPGEEETLTQEHQRASNAARLQELSQSALNLLSEEEDSVLTRLGAVGRQLQELQRLDTATLPLAEIQEQASASLRELQSGLSRYFDTVELDPARLQELEERLNLVHGLKRKYGATVVEVIAFGQEARQKLQQLEQREEELARINAGLKTLAQSLARAGQELSAQRRKLIPSLARAVSAELRELGFRQSHFDVVLSAAPQASASGLDQVEFQFAPNPGEPPRPLRAIASSGEIARVMLALKTVLAAVDEIPVLIFDEVDANVGGETATVVGEKMRAIGQRRQVLCITHLAPVAAAAAVHYEVTKQVKAGRTVSTIEQLDEEGRVRELTRMLGGAGPAARKHAEALRSAGRT